MKTSKCSGALLFLILTLNSCDIFEKDKDIPSLELTEVGFVGEIPTINKKINERGFTSDYAISLSTSISEGTYISKFLSMQNSQHIFSISLPYVKSDDDMLNSSIINSPDLLENYADEKYPLSTIKNMLSPGTKDILFNGDVKDVFILGINLKKDNQDFYSDGDQTGSYLKVVDLVEGTGIDSNNNLINTLEVTFEMDMKMYFHHPASLVTYAGNLKGLLRMRYKEKR